MGRKSKKTKQPITLANLLHKVALRKVYGAVQPKIDWRKLKPDAIIKLVGSKGSQSYETDIGQLVLLGGDRRQAQRFLEQRVRASKTHTKPTSKYSKAHYHKRTPLPTTKKFDGQIFTLGPYGFTKGEAQREAKKGRHVGSRIRVVNLGEGRGWGLYMHQDKPPQKL